MRGHNRWAASLLVIFLSASYLTSLVVREDTLNPILISARMTSDLQNLGLWAFLIDIVFFGAIFVWWRRKKAQKAQTEWESSFPL